MSCCYLGTEFAYPHKQRRHIVASHEEAANELPSVPSGLAEYLSSLPHMPTLLPHSEHEVAAEQPSPVGPVMEDAPELPTAPAPGSPESPLRVMSPELSEAPSSTAESAADCAHLKLETQGQPPSPTASGEGQSWQAASAAAASFGESCLHSTDCAAQHVWQTQLSALSGSKNPFIIPFSKLKIVFFLSHVLPGAMHLHNAKWPHHALSWHSINMLPNENTHSKAPKFAALPF